ncbi:MAG: Gfo/Idh/MocA family oxidoreductase, partial [Bacteroidota bacterium]|nr:Gfo/Idh/MocA family oxidoreductase [Bacteroidota bacterium]
MQPGLSFPEKSHPIIIIGAGGIVNDAHLPAYKIAGFEVAGIYDINMEKARNTAARFSIPVVYESINQLLAEAPPDVVFDLALPGNIVISAQVINEFIAVTHKKLHKPLDAIEKAVREFLPFTRT